MGLKVYLTVFPIFLIDFDEIRYRSHRWGIIRFMKIGAYMCFYTFYLSFVENLIHKSPYNISAQTAEKTANSVKSTRWKQLYIWGVTQISPYLLCFSSDVMRFGTAASTKRCAVIPTPAQIDALNAILNHLKPRGFFTYHQVEHSKILHSFRFTLSVLYGSQNRQRLLL